MRPSTTEERLARLLNPAGGARARVDRVVGAAPPFPAQLLRASAAGELDEIDPMLAWEVAKLARGLDRAERVTLALAVLALRAASAEGSTVLPFNGQGGLPEVLARMEVSDARASEVVRLLRRVQRSPERYLPVVVSVIAEPPLEVGGAVDVADTPALNPSASGLAPILVAEVPGGARRVRVLVAQRAWAMETRVAASLARRRALTRGSAEGAIAAQAEEEQRVESALADVLAMPPVVGGKPLRLSKEQRAAIHMAATHPVTVVSGGPGTGKTSIVVSLLRVLARACPSDFDVGRDVVLTAPTGKAADRMRGSVREALRALAAPGFDDRGLLDAPPAALTLHRLLGYSPGAGGFRHHERNPLGASVVIVDEASMIDLAMMDRLLRALPSRSRLVLLGDADQLPSVAAGSVFRDLTAAGGQGVCSLRKSYRMRDSDPAGSHVLHVARAINRGLPGVLVDDGSHVDTESPDSSSSARRDQQPDEGAKAVDDGERGSHGSGAPKRAGAPGKLRRRRSPDQLLSEGVEWLPVSNESTRDTFFRWWEARRRAALPDRDELFGRAYPLEDGRLIDPERLSDIHRVFEHALQAKLLCVTRGGPAGVATTNAYFHRDRSGRAQSSRLLQWGEPVMVQRNDYERGLFNGDQGVVLGARSSDSPKPHTVVMFPRGSGYVAFPIDSIRHLLELSFAMTVHKSQGSEYEQVAVLLPPEPMPMLTREILYTAVTRAKRSVVLVGERREITHAVARRVERHSLLGLLSRG